MRFAIAFFFFFLNEGFLSYICLGECVSLFSFSIGRQKTSYDVKKLLSKKLQYVQESEFLIYLFICTVGSVFYTVGKFGNVFSTWGKRSKV